MKKALIFVAVVVVLGLGLYLFQQRGEETVTLTPSVSISVSPSVSASATPTASVSPTPKLSPTPTGTAVSTIKTFTVTGKSFSFSPSQITVNKGDTVKIIFQNTEGNHDWRLDEFNVHTKVISTGQQDTVQFIADKAGTFEYYCSVGTHRQMGMRGNLIVK